MNLVDPGTLKAFLASHGVSPTKGLGQHFLCSRPAVDSIVRSLAGYPGILEIGPGPGVLTGPLSDAADRLIALELDERMVSALVQSAPRAEVHLADAMLADLPAVLAKLPEPRAVVSNLPYYITGPLITRIAEARAHWSKAVLMMQREVADKVVAPPGDRGRGSLSVYLQSQFAIRTVAQVPAGAFLPPPKVDSTVLEFVPLGESDFEFFFRLVRMGFAQPRKTLANNLSAGLAVARTEVAPAIETLGLPETVRPQVLTADQWRRLAAALANVGT